MRGRTCVYVAMCPYARARIGMRRLKSARCNGLYSLFSIVRDNRSATRCIANERAIHRSLRPRLLYSECSNPLKLSAFRMRGCFSPSRGVFVSSVRVLRTSRSKARRPYLHFHQLQNIIAIGFFAKGKENERILFIFLPFA